MGCRTQRNRGPESLIYSLSFRALPQPQEAFTGVSKATRGLQLHIGRDWEHVHYVLKPLLILFTPYHRGPLDAKTGLHGGQKQISFDPMTLQACHLAYRDLLCPNGNILREAIKKMCTNFYTLFHFGLNK